MEKIIRDRIEKIEKDIVPEGYKKTPIGIIPQDWQVKKLGEMGEFKLGKGISKNKLQEDGISCIIYGEIYTIYNYYIDKLNSKVSIEVAKNSTDISCGDILFASSGETAEDIGKAVMYVGNDKAVAGGDIIIFSPKKEIKTIFYSFLLNFNYINKEKYEKAQGHSVVHLYSSHLKEISIPILPLEEQKKIADILTLWDEYIENMDNLIEKKEELKKGLMQKLLTGEKRLPGHTQPWKKVKLGDVSEITSGNGFPEKYQNNLNGNIAFFKVSDLNNKLNYKFLNKANNYITKEDAIKISANLKKKNSIVIAKLGEAIRLERKRILKKDSFIDNNLASIFLNNKTNYLYVYYILLNTKISKYCNIGAVPSLNMFDLKNIKLNLPPLDEQRAISEILSKADEEIELLKELRDKKLEEKKGLMQLLLTGIIRV